MRILLEKVLNLTWRSPDVTWRTSEDIDIVPSCLDQHLRVVDQLTEHLVLDFAVELITQHFQKVKHSLTQTHQFLILH
jgi:hypothetical protein